MNYQTLEDLETAITWVGSHLEINSLVFACAQDQDQMGINGQDLSNFSLEDLKKFIVKLQKITIGLYYLPQTVIFDLGKKAQDFFAELSLGADIRLCHAHAEVHFDHLHKGLVPSCGGIRLLNHLVGALRSRSWILGGRSVSAQELLMSGFAYDTYVELNPVMKNLIKEINAQGPIPRIQAKRAFLDAIEPDLKNLVESEIKFTLAGLITLDWQQYARAKSSGAETHFTSATNFMEMMGHTSDKLAN